MAAGGTCRVMAGDDHSNSRVNSITTSVLFCNCKIRM